MNANIYFGVVAITAPILGSIFSGFVSSRIGGHQSPSMLPLSAIIGLISVIACILTPLCDNYALSIMMLWLFLFFSSMILPIFYGLIFIQVRPEVRPFSNSISYLLYNLLGWFPGPFVYGIINQVSNSDTYTKSRLGMTVLMDSSVLYLIFIWLAICTDKKRDHA